MRVHSRPDSLRTRPGAEIWREQPVRGGFPDREVLGLSGFERIRDLMRAGPRPPVSYLTGLHATDTDIGSCTFVMPATRWLLPPQGLISGGAVALLADAALGMAVHTALPSTTSELSIHLLRPIRADGGLLTTRTAINHTGKSVALSSGSVHDSTGRSVAYCSSRCYIFPPLDETPPPPDAREWVEPDYPGPHPFQRPAHGRILPLEEWRKRSGIEILEGLTQGGLPMPPIHYLTGLRPATFAEGTSTFTLPASPWLAAPHGGVHGGAIALLADSAIAGAIQTTVPAGNGYAMLDLKIYFTRPVPCDDAELTAEATVVNRSRSMAIATCEVTNAQRKRVAFASGSALIVDRPIIGSPPENHPPKQGERPYEQDE